MAVHAKQLLVDPEIEMKYPARQDEQKVLLKQVTQLSIITPHGKQEVGVSRP